MLYPGLPSHPGHAVAARQMSGFGAMLSIRPKGGESAAIATAAKVELWKRATSLGGVESLIEHRGSVEGPALPHRSVALSVGLEDPDDLFADLDQALRAGHGDGGMSGKILVLGAAGRLGCAAAEAFRMAGWSVTSLVRPGAAHRAPRGTKVVETIDRLDAIAAARGADVVLHALNPPFKTWRRMALAHAYSAIEVAETAGATLMFPGNLYNYGAGMPSVIDESTPMQPTTRKGDIRVEIEQRMQEAAERGCAPSFCAPAISSAAAAAPWFDLVITKQLARNEVTYPGPLDVVHEWAYVPDLAAAMVRLAVKRERLGAFETFGFQATRSLAAR